MNTPFGYGRFPGRDISQTIATDAANEIGLPKQPFSWFLAAKFGYHCP